MKGIVQKHKNGLVVVSTTRKKDSFWGFILVDVETPIQPDQQTLCKPGDAVVFKIRKVKGEKVAVIDTESIQTKLEREIVEWIGAGSKSTVELADKILSIVKTDTKSGNTSITLVSVGLSYR